MEVRDLLHLHVAVSLASQTRARRAQRPRNPCCLMLPSEAHSRNNALPDAQAMRRQQADHRSAGKRRNSPGQHPA